MFLCGRNRHTEEQANLMWHIHFTVFTPVKHLKTQEVQKLIVNWSWQIHIPYSRGECCQKTKLMQRLRTTRRTTSQLNDDNRFDWMTQLIGVLMA